MFNNFREESKLNWGVELENNQMLNREQIKLGAILRIADATEVMAKEHNQLLADLKYYKNRSERQSNNITKLYNINSGLRGYITRLKKKNG